MLMLALPITPTGIVVFLGSVGAREPVFMDLRLAFFVIIRVK